MNTDLRSLGARSQAPFDPRVRPIAAGTAAQKPAANLVRFDRYGGTFYYETDTATLWYSDGVTWQLVPRTLAVRAFRDTSGQSVAASTWTKVQLNGEYYDPFSVFDSATNYRFTPTRSGFYSVHAAMAMADLGGAANKGQVAIYINGTTFSSGAGPVIGGVSQAVISDVIFLNGTSDYLELWVQHNDADAATVLNGATLTFLSAAWVGA